MFLHAVVSLVMVCPCVLQGGKDPRPSGDLFPDPHLEAAIRECVPLKRDNAQPLEIEDVRGISQIIAKGKGIRDLRGLDRCTSLATLDLSENDVSDLTPLSRLPRLQGLFLAKNHIRDLRPISDLTGLQYLEVSDNEIEDLKPLARLSNLNTLSLANNRVSDPGAIAGLVRLWSLSLSGNGITGLAALRELKQLCILSLKGNRIEDLSPLEGIPALRMLFLENNRIRDLEVLVDMAERDLRKDKRFAPFAKIYLSGNPLSEAARGGQVAELRSAGVTVFLGEDARR